jgi:hypothetical protein
MKLHRYEPHIYSSLLGESRVLFEAIDTGDWVKASEHLKMVEKMKCRETCKHYDTNYHDAPCSGCADKTNLPKWELNK